MKYSELSGKMLDILKICEIEYLIFGVNWDKNGHKFSCSTQPEIANGFPPIENGAFVILQFSNFFNLLKHTREILDFSSGYLAF